MDLGRGSAGEKALADVLVEPVEEPVGDGEGGPIACAGEGEATDEDIESRRDRGVEHVIGEVGFVDDTPDLLLRPDRGPLCLPIEPAAHRLGIATCVIAFCHDNDDGDSGGYPEHVEGDPPGGGGGDGADH